MATHLEIKSSFLENLMGGKVCLHPAGTMFGLTCHPFLCEAYARLYEAKGRPADKQTLFLVSDYSKLGSVLEHLPRKWDEALEQIWPHHLTVVWNTSSEFRRRCSRVGETVGVRVPRFESSWFADALCAVDFPIPSTSVNVSGRPTITDRTELKQFCLSRDIWVPQNFSDQPLNNTEAQVPSTIIRIVDEDRFELLRDGAYSASGLIKRGFERL